MIINNIILKSRSRTLKSKQKSKKYHGCFFFERSIFVNPIGIIYCVANAVQNGIRP